MNVEGLLTCSLLVLSISNCLLSGAHFKTDFFSAALFCFVLMIQQRWLPLAWVVMVVQLLSHSQTEWLLVPMGLVWPSLTGFNHCRPFVMPIAAILVPVVAAGAAAAVTSIAFIFCSDVVVPTAYSNFHYVCFLMLLADVLK